MNDSVDTTTVLVVDIDEGIRETMAEFLEMSGYRTLSVESGEGALKIVESETVDILITEIALPGIDGLQLCDRIKKTQDTDVIVITGYSADYSYEEAISKGASDFLFKPVRFAELLLRIKRVIKDRHLTIATESALENLREQLLLYETIDDDNGENKIERIIEFPEEYFQAGVSILNYFGKLLQKQYPDKNAKVSIEQNGLTVKMVIVSPEGQKEVIERILNDYGLVMTGKADIEDFTHDRIVAMELRNELRIAHVRIESQKELIAYQNASIGTLNQLLENAMVSKPAKIEVNVPIANTTQFDFKQQFEISPKFTLIQSCFEELAKQHLDIPNEKEYLNELINAAKDLKQCKTKSEVAKSTALFKICKFINEIQKAETLAGKIIRTTKDGIEIMKIIAKHYNGIAQWAGLPQIPKPIVR